MIFFLFFCFSSFAPVAKCYTLPETGVIILSTITIDRVYNGCNVFVTLSKISGNSNKEINIYFECQWVWRNEIEPEFFDELPYKKFIGNDNSINNGTQPENSRLFNTHFSAIKQDLIARINEIARKKMSENMFWSKIKQLCCNDSN